MINVMHLLHQSIRLLLPHLENEQKAYRKTVIYSLLAQDARIIILKFKGTDSSLSLTTNNREKIGIFSVMTGLDGLAYTGISAYLNGKNKFIKKENKAIQSNQNMMKNILYQVSQKLISYLTYEIEIDRNHKH